MSPFDLTLAILLPALLAVSATCSAAETSLFSLTATDRAALRRSAPRAAAAAARLTAKPRALLITILIANIAANTAYMAVAALLATRLEGAWQAAAGGAAVLGLLLLGELLPKVLATAHKITFARLAAPLVLVFDRIVAPVRVLLDGGVVAPLTRLLRPPGAAETSPVTVEDLSALLDTAQSRQALHEDEQELLSDVLELSGRPVREVMTPRVDMAWLDESFTGEQVLDLVRKTGHHKFPVARRSLDGEVVGLLNAKTYLAARSFRRARNQAGDPPAKEHIEPATYIPDRAGLDRLLEHLRRTGTHTALCVDERGELTGLVQVEDVVRELVDAAPEPGRADGGGVREVGPGVWCVPGRLTVRDWREYFERSGSASPIDARVATVGGLVLAKLGRVPRAGDSVRLGAIELRVARMNGRRIEEVLVSRAGEGAS